MIGNILSFWATGPLEILIVLVFFGLTVALIVVFLRLLLRNKKENIRLRLEVGKLADELEQMRKYKSDGLDDSVKKSG